RFIFGADNERWPIPKLPGLENYLPHMNNSKRWLLPEFKISKGRTNVTFVIGIPSIKRPVDIYIINTLDSLIRGMNDTEKDETLLIVCITEPWNKTYEMKIIQDIMQNFSQEIESGLLDIITPLAAYYPDLSQIKPNLNDPPERVKWRSKQNLDYAYLMLHSWKRGKYYLQLEDDIQASPGYITGMTRAIRGNYGNWFLLQFSTLGFIGDNIRHLMRGTQEKYARYARRYAREVCKKSMQERKYARRYAREVCKRSMQEGMQEKYARRYAREVCKKPNNFGQNGSANSLNGLDSYGPEFGFSDNGGSTSLPITESAKNCWFEPDSTSLAYTGIAGLAPQYGLYSAFICVFIYCVMGSSKDSTLGPSAIVSLITASFATSVSPRLPNGEADPTMAIMLAFTTGIIVSFISFPVINAFSSAAAITIAVSQLKCLGHGHGDVLYCDRHSLEKTQGKLNGRMTQINPFQFTFYCTEKLFSFAEQVKVIYTYKMTVAASQHKHSPHSYSYLFSFIVRQAQAAIVVIVAAGILAILERYGVKGLTPTGYIRPGMLRN
ncbi:Alpha-1,3-mannosyl-glycoprotein 4-beta-N-acetylglucosaminyltransferase B, partial [Bulinus truncatus]